eukprot:TRINITY_DN2663_c0_g1_i1.p1 TRINITY_DN2663_c0_g1~~TRINITY_DN2663_c0_g1_i1.p1  ORF type:complete len:733 (-),score=102.81 TRINITY_DN2663_c0_g1_i1:136-2193(-)
MLGLFVAALVTPAAGWLEMFPTARFGCDVELAPNPLPFGPRVGDYLQSMGRSGSESVCLIQASAVLVPGQRPTSSHGVTAGAANSSQGGHGHAGPSAKVAVDTPSEDEVFAEQNSEVAPPLDELAEGGDIATTSSRHRVVANPTRSIIASELPPRSVRARPKTRTSREVAAQRTVRRRKGEPRPGAKQGAIKACVGRGAGAGTRRGAAHAPQVSAKGTEALIQVGVRSAAALPDESFDADRTVLHVNEASLSSAIARHTAKFQALLVRSGMAMDSETGALPFAVCVVLLLVILGTAAALIYSEGDVQFGPTPSGYTRRQGWRRGNDSGHRQESQEDYEASTDGNHARGARVARAPPRSISPMLSTRNPPAADDPLMSRAFDFKDSPSQADDPLMSRPFDKGAAPHTDFDNRPRLPGGVFGTPAPQPMSGPAGMPAGARPTGQHAWSEQPPPPPPPPPQRTQLAAPRESREPKSPQESVKSSGLGTQRDAQSHNGYAASEGASEVASMYRELVLPNCETWFAVPFEKLVTNAETFDILGPSGGPLLKAAVTRRDGEPSSLQLFMPTRIALLGAVICTEGTSSGFRMELKGKNMAHFGEVVLMSDQVFMVNIANSESEGLRAYFDPESGQLCLTPRNSKHIIAASSRSKRADVLGGADIFEFTVDKGGDAVLALCCLLGIILFGVQD